MARIMKKLHTYGLRRATNVFFCEYENEKLTYRKAAIGFRMANGITTN